MIFAYGIIVNTSTWRTGVDTLLFYIEKELKKLYGDDILLNAQVIAQKLVAKATEGKRWSLELLIKYLNLYEWNQGQEV